MHATKDEPALPLPSTWTNSNAGRAAPNLTTEEAKARIAEVAVQPRVTEEYIRARCHSVDYLKSGTATICIITMRNGFKVIGFTAPAHAGNYDEQVGARYAYDNAFKQLWQLEGYLLCERLSQSE